MKMAPMALFLIFVPAVLGAELRGTEEFKEIMSALDSQDRHLITALAATGGPSSGLEENIDGEWLPTDGEGPSKELEVEEDEGEAEEAVDCESYQSCGACAASSDCGWSLQKKSAVTGNCVKGTSKGPIESTSITAEASISINLRWRFSFCPALPCQGYTGCNTCLADALCGWCGDSQRCVEGDEGGPIAGVEMDSGDGCGKGYIHSPAPRLPHRLITELAKAVSGNSTDMIDSQLEKGEIQEMVGQLCVEQSEKTRLNAESALRPAPQPFVEVFRPNPRDQATNQTAADLASQYYRPKSVFRVNSCEPCRGTHPFCDCREPEDAMVPDEVPGLPTGPGQPKSKLEALPGTGPAAELTDVFALYPGSTGSTGSGDEYGPIASEAVVATQEQTDAVRRLAEALRAVAKLKGGGNQDAILAAQQDVVEARREYEVARKEAAAADVEHEKRIPSTSEELLNAADRSREATNTLEQAQRARYDALSRNDFKAAAEAKQDADRAQAILDGMLDGVNLAPTGGATDAYNLGEGTDEEGGE